MELNRVLFIPVSSPSGIGEYMRSMIIAKALLSRWPKLDVHFLLNEQVNYFNDCPYHVHSCKDSPTKDSAKVKRVLEQVNPDLVVFDASGRAKQFKKAKKLGAIVAFISQHNKKRARGLKLNRLLHTDIHWVAQPSFCMKALNFMQRAKLFLFNKRAPKNIGPIFETSSDEFQKLTLQKYGVEAKKYCIFNAGSGGHSVGDKLAADVYYQAAKAFYQKTQQKCLVVFGSNYPNSIASDSEVFCIKNIDNQEFVALLAGAKTCIISAGDTLLQCLALDKVCVAAAVSPDQPARLKLCQSHEQIFPAQPNVESLLCQTMKSFAVEQDTTNVKSTTDKVHTNGLDIIVDDIAMLFDSSSS